MDDQQFDQLLQLFGLSPRGYRKVRKGVQKRLRRHMQRLGCRRMEDYLLSLDKDRESRLEFGRLITVSISRFFRDKALWETLEKRILPDVIANRRGIVHAWSAGCACGEEAYSLRIVWEELKGRTDFVPDLQILATDINPLYLDKAKTGRYPASSLREVSEEVRSRYFTTLDGGNQYSVSPSLRNDLRWEEHDLLCDPPECEFHLIFLRNNLLTYYENELREPAFRKILSRLARGGFLVIGSHEKPPFMLDLRTFGRYQYVFRDGRSAA